MSVFHVKCESCGHGFTFSPTLGLSGYLKCDDCGELVSDVDVSALSPWIDKVVAQRQKLLRDGSHPNIDPQRASKDGLGAELAACVSLCPGFLNEWRQKTEAMVGSDTGEDLLGRWIGFHKNFEIKQTKNPRGLLFIRSGIMNKSVDVATDVRDSVYVLFTGEANRFTGRCWADRELFVANGVHNPTPLPPGRPSFGNNCGAFHPFSSIRHYLHLLPHAGGESPALPSIHIDATDHEILGCLLRYFVRSKPHIDWKQHCEMFYRARRCYFVTNDWPNLSLVFWISGRYEFARSSEFRETVMSALRFLVSDNRIRDLNVTVNPPPRE